jgi:hypothetical protein
MPTPPGSWEQSTSWIVSAIEGSCGLTVNLATGVVGDIERSFR